MKRWEQLAKAAGWEIWSWEHTLDDARDRKFDRDWEITALRRELAEYKAREKLQFKDGFGADDLKSMLDVYPDNRVRVLQRRVDELTEECDALHDRLNEEMGYES